ncbi:MAG: hypothetical protein IKF42_06305 [Mogibacterium sp.]|nr:hypothetical protein [Mogibacterium sp.]
MNDECINDMQEFATDSYQQGYRQGYRKGYKMGYNVGRTDGYLEATKAFIDKLDRNLRECEEADHENSNNN